MKTVTYEETLYKLVPKVPTPQMLDLMHDYRKGRIPDVNRIFTMVDLWGALVEVAPIYKEE